MSAFAIETAPDPLLGKVLQDRYRVVRKLGEGGMGAVYEGEHLVIKKRVAIKVLHPQYATSADIVGRFHQEALAATAIGHEHIVEVNDMGRTPDGAIFMVLEFLAGTDFAGLLEKEKRLSIARVVHIVSQVCEGVQAAHDKGIVHRDLKPENVFLIRRGGDPEFAKVLDFGISKFQDDAGGRTATKTGSVLGTAYYMSPEQAQGKKTVDHRSDVWALGVILFKALTGRYPFDDDAYPMLVLKICTERPPPVRSLRPDVPEALASAIDRCMERDVSRRVQSCRELRTLLQPFAGLEGAPPVQTDMAFASTVMGEAAVATPPMASAKPAPEITGGMERPASRATNAASGIRATGGSPRWVPMVAVVLVASALAGGGVWFASRPPEVTPTVETPAAVPEPPPPSEPVVAEEIEFIVSPSEAVVLLDGRPISARPDGRLTHLVDPDDGALHELRVEARDFRSSVEDIRLSYRQRIVVQLRPGTGVDDRRGTAPPAPPREPTSGHRPHTPTTPTTPTGTASHMDHASAHSPVTGGGGEGRSATGTGVTPRVEPPPPEPVAEPVVEAPPPTVPLVDGVIAPPPRAGLKRLVIP